MHPGPVDRPCSRSPASTWSRPTARVNLGTYGLVYVAGMTLDEAKQAVETQLANYLDKPQVSISVFAYNSKVYYVITEGAGQGDLVARLADHRQRDGAGRDLADQRPEPAVEQEHLDRAARAQRRRLRRDPAGQLDGDHGRRGHGHQLSGAAGRPHLHRREQADRHRRRAQPGSSRPSNASSASPCWAPKPSKPSTASPSASAASEQASRERANQSALQS